MLKSEFDALPIGAKMQCQYSDNVYQKTGSYVWVNQAHGYWSSLVVYSEA